MKPVRIGTRESILAVIQSEIVGQYLTEKGIEYELVTMKTTGDKILNKTLDKIGGKGLFVKELMESKFNKQVNYRTTRFITYQNEFVACKLRAALQRIENGSN